MSWLVTVAILVGVAMIALNLANSRIFRRGGRRPTGMAGLPQAFAWLRHRAVVVIGVLAAIGLVVLGLLYASPALDWAGVHAGTLFLYGLLAFVLFGIVANSMPAEWKPWISIPGWAGLGAAAFSLLILFGPGLSNGLTHASRCLNTECSADSDYVPLYDNQRLSVRPNESRRLVRMRGTIRIPIPRSNFRTGEDYCILIRPEGTVIPTVWSNKSATSAPTVQYVQVPADTTIQATVWVGNQIECSEARARR